MIEMARGYDARVYQKSMCYIIATLGKGALWKCTGGGGVEGFQCGHNQKRGGGIGNSSFLKKGGPKSKGEALEEGRRGNGTEGWCVPHHPIYI